MNPIETLVREHRLIERLLDDLERWARAPDDGRELGPLVRRLVDYVPRHHGKEQDVMFAATLDEARAHVPYDAMEAEYHQARALADRLLELHEQAVPWTARDRAAAAAAAYEYASLMRHHIRREGEVLYPVVWSDWADP